MNRNITAFTAFMLLFAAIVMNLFYMLPHSDITLAEADTHTMEKCVYLTFDDGPSDRVTPKILDTLKLNGIKATFFIVGNSAERRKNIIERMHQEGHTIGVHSYTHDYKEIYSDPHALIEDIEKCNDLIEEITGERSNIYRFPGGSYGLREELINTVTAAGYRYVDWNASVRDAELINPTPSQLLNAAKTSSSDHNNIVLLCHDSTTKITTATALEDIISYYRMNGYTFCCF